MGGDALEVTLLVAGDCVLLHSSFSAMGWRKPPGLFEAYFGEQGRGERLLWVARCGDSIAGFVTLGWRSTYLPFAELGVPEIGDLNVYPDHRRRGVASALLDVAEAAAFARAPAVGIAVGLYAAYGPAQRLYVKRGYVPDGRGVTAHGAPVAEGATVGVDDDLLLWLLLDAS